MSLQTSPEIKNTLSVKGIAKDRVATLKANKKLRELLWLRHGCSISALYGDDGEMQCHSCQIDFKRDSIEVIKKCLHSKRGLLNDN